MLTADLVAVTRRNGELKVRKLSPQQRGRALTLASQYVTIARDHVGKSRQAFDAACAQVPVENRDRRLAAGLLKLVDDRCLFEPEESGDPVELRRQLFEHAAAVRKALEPGQSFDREQVLAAGAEPLGLSADAAERLLYADLRQAHVMQKTEVPTAEALVDLYPTALAQAVLLRATDVVIEVQCQSAGSYRALFRKLKFRRLLHRIEKSKGKKGYRIEIDGPLSLFSSVTKYGLQLALVLPAIMECDSWSLQAQVLWGKSREPLEVHLAGKTKKKPGPKAARSRLPDDVAALVTKLKKTDSGWTVKPAAEILDLPGLGLCVPDLKLTHNLSQEVAYLEVLGFWSRDAVWKRVELVEAGLSQRVLFAVPKKLRVSEKVLGDDLPSSLYVYSGTMSAKKVIQHLDALL